MSFDQALGVIVIVRDENMMLVDEGYNCSVENNRDGEMKQRRECFPVPAKIMGKVIERENLSIRVCEVYIGRTIE